MSDLVKIETITQRFRRSRNGAWMSAGHDTHVQHIRPEDLGVAWVESVGLSSHRIITWPDGHMELFGYGSGMSLYGPGDSRLLPEELRRPGGTWYVHSHRIYFENEHGDVEVVEVPR